MAQILKGIKAPSSLTPVRIWALGPSENIMGSPFSLSIPASRVMQRSAHEYLSSLLNGLASAMFTHPGHPFVTIRKLCRASTCVPAVPALHLLSSRVHHRYGTIRVPASPLKDMDRMTADSLRAGALACKFGMTGLRGS